MVKSTKSQRTYTLAEIDNRLRSDGFSEGEAKEVVTSLERTEIPEGGIRFKDALEKYELPKGTLGKWVSRGHVRILRRVSWKFVILSEDDVRRMVARRNDGRTPK